jgi:hypothetical protein
MRLYDKTLKEIYGDVPWQFKIVIWAGLAFIALTIIYVPYVYYNLGKHEVRASVLSIPNKPKYILGALDPSIAYNGHNFFLAHTVVLQSDIADNSFIPTEVRIAVGSNYCHSWGMLTGGFVTRAEEIIGPDAKTPVKKGVWRIETPTLVYDPDDKGREWKLYAYKYFWAQDVPLARLYGVIVYKYASEENILSGKWSSEEWALSASEESPPYPYNQVVKATLNKINPALADVYFYSRPSVINIDNTLVMSLSAYVKGRDTPDRIIIIASKDHGKTWHYLGAPIKHDDVPAIKEDMTTLQGGTLIVHNKQPYLAAVFGNDKVAATGTQIFGFSNISKATLLNDQVTGKPMILNYIPLHSRLTKIGGGFATYNDACKSGVITAERSGDSGRYEMFQTQRLPLPVE